MMGEISTVVNFWIEKIRDNTTVYHDLAINLGLALVGIVVFVLASGWVSWVGAVWAILNIAPIVTWAVGL